MTLKFEQNRTKLWHGMTREDTARHDKAREGTARHKKTWARGHGMFPTLSQKLGKISWQPTLNEFILLLEISTPDRHHLLPP